MEVRNNVARRYSAIISQVGDGAAEEVARLSPAEEVGDGAAEEVARDPAEEVEDGPLKKWEKGPQLIQTNPPMLKFSFFKSSTSLKSDGRSFYSSST